MATGRDATDVVLSTSFGASNPIRFEAVAELRKRGFTARRLEDGLPEWKAAGMAVEFAE